MIDIDHLSEHDLDLETLKKKFTRDSRLELMFVSPSGDGLKLMFRLSEQITDPSYYVTFYKAFCLSFGKQYCLGAALDHKTHDVSRCCFVSCDLTAYFNPDSSPIIPTEFVSQENFWEMEQVEIAIKETEKIQRQVSIEKQPEKGIQKQALPDSVMDRIKEKMGMRVKRNPEKEYIQPKELEEIMTVIEKAVKEVGVNIESVKPISYGRQIRFGAENIWSEINIFSGKKGVSIVGTTKTGSNKAFCNQMVEYLITYLN
ncbi:CRISPR-associated primase-polymerase type B [Cyclobacterium qasimii]|uniref:CRISPR-associated primase-polymerase type B n=1 Tax=Cyclobacterium qasimii TaxID=1350429 RepID=UPI00058F1C87|nr:CRISPR-associated primase-polymerase type B [Cyclobacterium qasimii]